MNFGLFPMLKRYKDFKHDWEPAMLEGSHDLVFRNSFKDIRYALETLNSTGTRYEIECYDTSHLYNLHYFWTEGLPVAAIAAAIGGNVRVGLEDSLWIGAGQLAASNADKVTQVRKIIEGLGLDVATADEAREILELKGGDKVAF